MCQLLSRELSVLLSITTTHWPATDLGYLLHKNPARFQSFTLTFGQAHVFYPEATEECCTATLLLDVDPVQLVRGRAGSQGDAGSDVAYVNDRPYAASSFLSVAIAEVYRNGLGGRSRERPEIAAADLPLTARLPVLPCRGGEAVLRRLFEPLGYTVTTERLPLDPRFPEWGESRYFAVELQRICRLSDLLSHLYVLVPVLDDDKHYWVGQDEIEKLLRHGAGWLASHPERQLITDRYLVHQRTLTRAAITRLNDDSAGDPDSEDEEQAREEEVVEERISLNQHRIGTVVATLKSVGARRVLDLGCGEGQLIGALLGDRSFERIVGMDVSRWALDRAAKRLHLDRLPPLQRQRIELIQGSLVYRDPRLEGFDTAAIVEVIEHLDAPRLAAFERVVFAFARPQTVVVTTPNAEYNLVWESLKAGRFRHRDHRFEWSREEFGAWATGVADRHGYGVRFLPVGPVHEQYGSPTQMAVFGRD
jgi:3' terminal RNA ribose 2'-O-methyltransferase Hen1